MSDVQRNAKALLVEIADLIAPNGPGIEQAQKRILDIAERYSKATMISALVMLTSIATGSGK